MKNKTLIWSIAGVVVVGLVVWAILANDHRASPQAAITTQNSTASTTVSTNVNSATFSNNANYQAELTKFGNYRIQFSQTCQATPFNVTYTSGTSIMLDNRSNITHVIKLDGLTYTIGAYDFAIATLTSSALPHTTLIDCDAHQNVATVLLQK